MMSSFSAFSFIQPLAWFGLAAVTIPIIIHLLSKSRGRLVKWGTTRFLPQAKPIKMTKFKLTQRLLLLLRCLIVLFSLAILAKLYMTDDSRTGETVVLVNKTWFSDTSEQDRMLLEGYIESSEHQVVWLDNLESVTKEDVINFTNNESNYNTLVLNSWYQLSLADTQFINAKQFIVFSSANTLQFVGEKTLISRPIQWNIRTIKLEKKINDLIQEPFNVVLFADDGHQIALDYLIPALNVIKQFNIKQLTLQVITQEKDLNLIKRPDWLFYLTNKPITEQFNEWLVLGTNIFIDGKNNESVIKQDGLISKGYGLIKPVKIYQYNEKNTGEIKNTEHQILWAVTNHQASKNLTINSKTNEITPVLTVFKNYNLDTGIPNETAGSLYQYYSLLTPQWSELVTQPQFPLVLQTLLFGELITSQQQAINQISPDNLDQLITRLYEQALTMQQQKEMANTFDNIASSYNAEAYESYHQQVLVWLGFILMTLFILERLLSEYSTRTSVVVSKDD
ncbi:BatA domain-containing protein [Thalassotalea profundi]|uniref:Aerotolerance regulator N-terminal domain-containing protein n=1 Tax=Thalassotalea profundi TaxID=2036687 RepID=A0ABQ3IPA9_9GAMM|nr:BatA domain-containing protein [Thalassotalea profundi]GHE90369.1 hypothetical protein GCM10011501_19700 [Thalassotalea profundi]